MKKNMKRCTNSNCRKLFVANNVCPYCGKQYPRVTPVDAEYEVTLAFAGHRTKRDIKQAHEILGCKMLKLRHGPVSVDRFRKYEEAVSRVDELNQLEGYRAAIRRLR